MQKMKALMRSGNRKATDDRRRHPAEKRAGRPPEQVLCERCGASFHKRSWRRPGDATASHAALSRASWSTCPACAQQRSEEYLGRVRIDGEMLRSSEPAIRRRIRNVAARAEFTQPERRVVSLERSGDTLEVLTTSQKLAHRIVHELKKAFGGRAVYKWSDDGFLEARWRAGSSAAGTS